MTSKIRPKVLIADDCVDACEMFAEYLRFHDFEVWTAFDGAQAIEAARLHGPDIILLDLSMPEMTGTDAMRVLKSEPAFADVPIVALTAHALPSSRAEAMQAGFDDYISKPILPDALVTRLRQMLPPRVDTAGGHRNPFARRNVDSGAG